MPRRDKIDAVVEKSLQAMAQFKDEPVLLENPTLQSIYANAVAAAEIVDAIEDLTVEIRLFRVAFERNP